MASNFHDMSDIQCVDQKSSGSDSSSTGEEERLRQLFLSCDSNNDGCLDCKDLYNMCKKLNMTECAEEIINTLGANTKGCITFDEFLSCREKVFQMQTEADNIYFSRSGLPQHLNYKQPGFSWSGYTSDKLHTIVQNNGQEVNENSVRKINENVNLESSASETSLVNSGAEYDSGAQDLCGEPQSLHLLMQRDFPDLYKMIFPLPLNSIRNNFENDTITNEFNLLSINDMNNSTKDLHNQKLANTINIQSVDKLSNLSKHIETESFSIKSIEVESNNFLDNVRHLFECANTLHVQQTAQLRSEIRDLSHRLQGLQTSRDINHREVQRLQRDKEQLRNELTNQVSRYEDRLTELHSVIAELRRRLEHSESNIIHEVEEFEENDGEDDDDNNDNGNDKVNDNHVSMNYKSNRKSKLSFINTFNTNKIKDYSMNEYELDKDISGNSDTSVDVIMDGDDDDDDDDDGDNVEDVVNPSNDVTKDKLNKYIGIINQYHPSQLNSHQFLIQTSNQLACLDNDNNNNNDNNNVNTEGVSRNYNHSLCIKYETIISNMQAQLTCVIEERDRLANQLNELTGTNQSLLPNSTIITEGVSSSLPLKTSTVSTISEVVGLKSCSISHPIMGLNQSVQMKSNNSNLSYPLTSSLPTPSSTTGFSISKQQTNIDNNIVNQLHKTTSLEHLNDNKVTDTTTKSSSSSSAAAATTTATLTTITTQMNSNVYDLPEPEWITQILKQYYEYNITNNKQNIPTTATTTTTATNNSVGELCIDSIHLPISFTPYTLMLFLSNLAYFTPYKRLSDIAQCAQLILYRLLTILIRYQSDCLVLQANLTEIKLNTDQMQCYLNQIESNWSIMKHTIQLSESALEISNCLNQLYSTELAVTIFRQSQNNQLMKHPFSTISSSTSSSSFHGHNKSSQLHQSQHPQQLKRYNNNNNNTQQISVTTSPYQLYSSIGSSEEHDLLNNVVTTINNTTSGVGQQQQQQQIFSMNHFNLHNLKLLRQQVEYQAYTILDKYETSDGGYEKILPTSLSNLTNIHMTTTSSNNSTIPIVNGTNLSQLHNYQHIQSPISPGLCSIQSVITSSNSLLDNNNNNNSHSNSVYANSWYVSLNRNKLNPLQCLSNEINEQLHLQQSLINTNQSLQPLPSITLNSTIGSIPSVTYSQRQYNNNNNNNIRLNNPHLRSFMKLNSQGNTNHNINENGDGYGWETPDSGAGSSSINEISSQHHHHHHHHQQQQQHHHHHHQHQRQQSGYLLNPSSSLFLSSSTSSLLFGHYYQTYGDVNQTNTMNKVNHQSDLFMFNTLLDNLPPLWTLFTKTSTSLYESDIDSSDSSDLPGNIHKTTDLSKHITHPHHHHHHGPPPPPVPPVPPHHHHQQQQHNSNSSINGQLMPQLPLISSSSSQQLSNWSRLEERKLRIIYYQLIHTYKRLQSMLIDIPNTYQSVIPNDTNEIGDRTKPTNDVINYDQNISSVSSIQQPIHLDQNNSISMNSLRKLPLAVFLENSVLLQELCCIKEECADLKIRVYLLEKELRANRLTLDSRAVAERALRAHLDALIIEQNNQYSIINDNNIKLSQFIKTTTVTATATATTMTTTTTTTTTGAGTGTTLTNQSIQNINQNEIVLLRGQVKNLLQALEALRSSTEIQQIQSEELVNDLKRANSALIKAFNKIKYKYTTRIKKLENQLNSIHSIPSSTYSTSFLSNLSKTNISITTYTTTTTTTSSITSTTHNNDLSNTFKGYMIEHHNMNEISKASIVFNDINNVNMNCQIYPIYPIQSDLSPPPPSQQQQQQPIITTSTHSLNIPSMIDYHSDLSLIPTSHIPAIPLHQQQQQQPQQHYPHPHYPQIQQQQQQQPITLNTSQLRTMPLSTTTPTTTTSQHFANLKHFPTH
ncbi:unnamed protein product [Schistosoma spindalis]|nr:unnamed protein product [Schistosoma spindale]